MIKIS
jgi:electron-transferring-flavoprotein dehydrogenase